VKTRLSAAFFAAAALAAAACDASPVLAFSLSQVERVEPAVRVEAGEKPALAVDSPAGSVTLVADLEGKECVVTATKRAPAEADLDRIKVKVEKGADGTVNVGWTAEGDRKGLSVSFAIVAPKGSAVSIATGAGSVEAESFEKGIRIRTGSGSVTTKYVVGDLALETRAGSIDVMCGSGKVNAKTGAGSVQVRGRDGDLDVESAAGSIEILNARGSVRAQTGAGSVKVEGSLQGDCVAKSSAGAVEVRIPEKSSLVVEGKTNAGSIETDFDLKVEGKTTTRTVSGTLGDGKGGTLKVETGAGSIEIRKR
jgi:hypothetical protein